MIGFIVRRLVWAFLLAAIITLFTFVIFFIIPTDTRSTLSGQGSTDPTLAGQFHLRDKPVTTQYVSFLGHLVQHGDLGRSIRSGVPVRDTIIRALPVTASLVIGGVVTWFLIAFPIGILSALRPRSLVDKGLMMLVLIGASAHPIWLGLVLSYLLGYKLHVFPLTGYCNFFGKATFCGGPTQWTYHMLLPWFTFACLFAALYARMIRASMLEAMDADYVRTAKAKGAGTWQVVRHLDGRDGPWARVRRRPLHRDRLRPARDGEAARRWSRRRRPAGDHGSRARRQLRGRDREPDRRRHLHLDRSTSASGRRRRGLRYRRGAEATAAGPAPGQGVDDVSQRAQARS